MKLDQQHRDLPTADSSSDRIDGSSSPTSNMPSSPPSSPPSQTEEKPQIEKPQVKKPRTTINPKAEALDTLLAQCSLFSDVLKKKTEVLGRLGHGFDGQALGEHDLELSKQPECMVGGTMRDYQLEGLTWMFEIASQGMSGILADEMGLGKTIQTIGLLAKLWEEAELTNHLIVAPLSTLSNWQDEFEKWTPKLPAVMYHGDPKERKEIFSKKIMKNVKNGKPTAKFPVVFTTPEIIIRDHKDLGRVEWEMIIIDEGHRLKNSESKLFQIMQTFHSQSRFLITGTPLQNNLKELWSLLNFLLPKIFTSWLDFESWFDFSELKDEDRTEEFLQNEMKQDLVKKMHLILQPLLLRRIKADVEHLLPKKREYVLYAPMTKEQTELYNIISDRSRDTRAYLEEKVVERLTGATNTPAMSLKASPTSTAPSSLKMEDSDSDDDVPMSTLTRAIVPPPQKRGRGRPSKSLATKNAFQQMMERKASEPAKNGRKRKLDSTSSSPAPKSVKSSRQSTPALSARGRKIKAKAYTEADTDAEEALSDDDFEQMLVEDFQRMDYDEGSSGDQEEIDRAKTLELAKKEIANKKLGNMIMQLRLVCNSPHNFYNPWTLSSGLDVDETLITSSGKMLLLDRLLPSLFSRGSKVLIFSQFKKQLDHLETYARDLRHWNVCRIDGGVSQDDRRQQIRDFNTNPDTRLFLLTTRAGGQGINLATADTVVLFDSDWNPQQDLQAQDRAHRIGQKNPVIIYRLATKGTVEESLLMSADAKRRLEKLVIKKGGFKSMGQKLGGDEDMSEEALKTLLLKDGMVYEVNGNEEILSEQDLDVLTDRSAEAYERAEKGEGDQEGMFKIVETKVGGLMTGMDRKKKV